MFSHTKLTQAYLFAIYCKISYRLKVRLNMGKQENVNLSVETVIEIFRDLLKEQEKTLLTTVSNSTKLIHQRLQSFS